MKKILRFQALYILFVGLLMSSCDYDFIVEPEGTIPDPTDTIYFSGDIEPIFNTGDNCTACHKTGGQAPDLTTGNAYNSIQSMSLVNLSDPEMSELYIFPNPDNTSDHTWKKYTSSEAQLVLQWIEQGALNN